MDKDPQKHTSHGKGRFLVLLQRNQKRLIFWCGISFSLFSSFLVFIYLLRGRVRTLTHKDSWEQCQWDEKDEKGPALLALLFLIRQNEGLCWCQRAGSSTLSRTEPPIPDLPCSALLCSVWTHSSALSPDLSYMIEATGNGNSQCNLTWHEHRICWRERGRQCGRLGCNRGRKVGMEGGRGRERSHNEENCCWWCEDSWLKKKEQ